MCEKGIQAIDVKPELHKTYNQWVTETCRRFSWGSGTCHNYYTTDSGDSPFLYPDDYKSFMKMRAECVLSQFDEC